MNEHASMNRIYRLVWSQVRGAWMPVAETARARGKSGRARSASRAEAAASAALGLLAMSWAHAGPTGGQIVAGKGSISQSGGLTDIRQSTQTLSIDWLSFNVAPHETVDFIQPSASAIAVNRIGGNAGSEILGHLESNGQVYLINPNGVLFGAGAQVNVGGLGLDARRERCRPEQQSPQLHRERVGERGERGRDHRRLGRRCGAVGHSSGQLRGDPRAAGDGGLGGGQCGDAHLCGREPGAPQRRSQCAQEPGGQSRRDRGRRRSGVDDGRGQGCAVGECGQ